jgi:hypothetical protein
MTVIFGDIIFFFGYLSSGHLYLMHSESYEELYSLAVIDSLPLPFISCWKRESFKCPKPLSYLMVIYTKCEAHFFNIPISSTAVSETPEVP